MAKKSLKALLTIVEGGQGKKLAEWYKKNQLTCQFRTVGRGTASSDLMDILGFGSPERDILIGFCEGSQIEKVLDTIQEDESEDIEAKGIACSMPITAMNTIAAAVFLNDKLNHEGRKRGTLMEEKVEDKIEEEHSLVLVVVNHGHTDDVMETARKSGARGGTIIRSRWVGTEESEKFYGFTIQEDKEIIAIVAGKEQRKLIMENINKAHGMNTKARAMCCSLAIDQIQRIG